MIKRQVEKTYYNPKSKRSPGGAELAEAWQEGDEKEIGTRFEKQVQTFWLECLKFENRKRGAKTVPKGHSFRSGTISFLHSVTTVERALIIVISGRRSACYGPPSSLPRASETMHHRKVRKLNFAKFRFTSMSPSGMPHIASQCHPR